MVVKEGQRQIQLAPAWLIILILEDPSLQQDEKHQNHVDEMIHTNRRINATLGKLCTGLHIVWKALNPVLNNKAHPHTSHRNRGETKVTVPAVQRRSAPTFRLVTFTCSER